MCTFCTCYTVTAPYCQMGKGQRLGQSLALSFMVRSPVLTPAKGGTAGPRPYQAMEYQIERGQSLRRSVTLSPIVPNKP